MQNSFNYRMLELASKHGTPITKEMEPGEFSYLCVEANVAGNQVEDEATLGKVLRGSSNIGEFVLGSTVVVMNESFGLMPNENGRQLCGYFHVSAEKEIESEEAAEVRDDMWHLTGDMFTSGDIRVWGIDFVGDYDESCELLAAIGLEKTQEESDPGSGATTLSGDQSYKFAAFMTKSFTS